MSSQLDRGWAEQPDSKKARRAAPKKKTPKQQQQREEELAEQELAVDVFGEDVVEKEQEQQRQPARGRGGATSQLTDEPVEEKQAAWIDEEEDEEAMVKLGSKARLKKLRAKEGEKSVRPDELERRLRDYHGAKNNTDWTTRKDEDEGLPGLSKLASSSAAVVDVNGATDRIDVVRCKDANVSEPSKASVLAVDFDGEQSLMLAAGLDKMLRIFRIDAAENPKLASVLFKDTPIHSARFLKAAGTSSSATVVVAGRRPWYHTYDVATGEAIKVPRQLGRSDKSLEKFAVSPDGTYIGFTCENGHIAVADARRSQWVSEDMKMNGTARAVSFSSDSRRLIAAGGDAEVYVWDLRSRRCMERFVDAGGSKTSAMAVAARPQRGVYNGDADYLAVGSESGVVNVYDRDVQKKTVFGGAPAVPIRPIMNLQTTISSMAISADSGVLAIASKWAKDALRLVHLPTCRVFANWPTSSTPLHYVTSLAMSQDGLLAIGNDRGRVLLYKLNHLNK